MTATSSLIHRSAGAPAMEGEQRGWCRACGAASIGMMFGEWIRETFTDHDKLRDGTIVCHACQFCFTDRNAALQAATGKDKPQRMRNYSHFVVSGEWRPISKGEKRAMLAALLHDPEVAVIADSGQKHLIFRATPGWWQFEEVSMLPQPARLAEWISSIERLYMEFSKQEIASGQYSIGRIMRFGPTAWQQLEQHVKQMRGAPLFGLAVFLAQKEEEVAGDGTSDSGQLTLADVARDS